MRSKGRSRQRQREHGRRQKKVKRQQWGRSLHVNGLEWRWSANGWSVTIRPPAELLSGLAARRAHSGLPQEDHPHSGLPAAGRHSGPLCAPRHHSGLVGEALRGTIRVTLTDLTGMSWEALEDNHQNITPGLIKFWIETEILGKRDPLYALCELLCGSNRARLLALYTESRHAH